MNGNRKYVNITLDKPRKLLLDMNAMIEFERAIGMPFLEWSQRMARRNIALARQKAIEEREQAVKEGNQEIIEKYKNVPDPDAEDLKLPDVSLPEIRAFLWCMLLHEDESLTLKHVGSFIYPQNMEMVMGSLIAARDANSPEADPNAKKQEGEHPPPA